MAKGKLTEKQKRFADFYIETANATEAYLKAGYKVSSNGTARTNASRLLTNANISTYIDEQMSKKDAERIASQDEVLQFLTTVMRGEVTEQVPVVLMKEFEMVNKEPAVKDRTKAAELLGKRYQLFTDRVQHEGDMTFRIKMPDDWGQDT